MSERLTVQPLVIITLQEWLELRNRVEAADALADAVQNYYSKRWFIAPTIDDAYRAYRATATEQEG